jgi:sugar phosphate isomerase/epimerase
MARTKFPGRRIAGGLSFLSLIALLASLIAAAPFWGSSGRPVSAAEKPGWKLAVQAWTFNSITLFDTIDRTKAAGAKYLEAFPGQRVSSEENVPFNQDAPMGVLAKVKVKLDKAGVKLVNYGVEILTKDEARARKIFDFAKLMGIETIVTEPEKDAYELLDRLSEEYGINLAIHNHPKPSPYWSPDIILDAVKGRSKRIGACADTGHWMRSGIDPLGAVKKLEGRIISSHFKDLNRMGAGEDVIWGTGQGKAKEILAELYRQGFKGVLSIEYEAPMKGGEVEGCVRFLEAVTEELAKSGAN